MYTNDMRGTSNVRQPVNTRDQPEALWTRGINQMLCGHRDLSVVKAEHTKLTGMTMTLHFDFTDPYWTTQ